MISGNIGNMNGGDNVEVISISSDSSGDEQTPNQYEKKTEAREERSA